MGQILALDYGTKRIGVAATDDMQIIASGVGTVHSSEIIDFLQGYLGKHKVDTIVIGMPKNLDGSATDSTELVEKFEKHISRTFSDVKVELIDERFTSKIASQSILMSGVKKQKRKEKGLIDEVSATIILQDYMERNQNGFNF